MANKIDRMVVAGWLIFFSFFFFEKNKYFLFIFSPFFPLPSTRVCVSPFLRCRRCTTSPRNDAEPNRLHKGNYLSNTSYIRRNVRRMSWLQGRTWFATPPPKGVAFPNRLLLYIFLIVRKWRENVYVLFLSRSLFSSSSSYWGLRFPLFVPASIWKEKKGRRNTGWGWERRKKKVYGGVRKEEMNHFLVVFHRWKKNCEIYRGWKTYFAEMFCRLRD